MKKNKLKKGIAIEYAIIMILVVVAFIMLMFTFVTSYSTKSKVYSTYIEKKQYLDNIASKYIANEVNGEINDLNVLFGNNKYGYIWTITEDSVNQKNTLYVFRNQSVVCMRVVIDTSVSPAVVENYVYEAII